ncbi:MAG TPA: metallophosphoesterase [Acetobacteraceae bacterium]|nr:metallophosphoesterase [Acetobacteraceae bacterium]
MTELSATAVATGTADEPGATRRGALKCMLWTGAAAVWTVTGGVPRSRLIVDAAAQTTDEADTRALRFVQISDSHIGFAKPPNHDTPATLAAAIALARREAADAALMIHTGDVSHLSRDAQFDTAAEIIRGARLDTHYVPGEHDVLQDDGANFFARFMPKAQSGGWYSFDQQGVHFVALNNVQNLKAGGLGSLGPAQLAWLAADLRGRPASQPIVVFAHMPLWTVYADWGWGTEDAEQALTQLRRFGSVTVLNGHIHQIMQKVEGHVAFHTARSTAFPQSPPGSPAGPGPIKTLPAGRLRSTLGITRVASVHGGASLAVIDTPLGA